MPMQISSEKSLSVTDFSRVPSGRYPKDGPDNGEAFRKKFLVPALKEFSHVTVRLDGASGFPSSFLDEAFGGLVRSEGYSSGELHRRLAVRCDEPELTRYVSLIWRYIDSPANLAMKKD